MRLIKLAHQVMGDNGDKSRRQAALGNKHGVGGFRYCSDLPGGLNIFGGIKIIVEPKPVPNTCRMSPGLAGRVITVSGEAVCRDLP